MSDLEYTMSAEELQRVGDHARETIRNVLTALRQAEAERDLWREKVVAHHQLSHVTLDDQARWVVSDDGQCPVCKEVEDASRSR